MSTRSAAAKALLPTVILNARTESRSVLPRLLQIMLTLAGKQSKEGK